MTEEILNRFREICPLHKTQYLSLEQLIEDCNVAFKIVGFKPENLRGSVTRVYLDQDIEDLSDFAYAVWRLENE